MRAFACLLVLIFHCSYFEFYASISNHFDRINLLNSAFFDWVPLLTMPVDIFLYMSGFLVSYLTIPKLQQKKSKFSWLKFFTRRLIRLIPVYFFVLLFGLYVLKFTNQGPQWSALDEINSMCRDYSWENFLFINNIVIEKEPPCMVCFLRFPILLTVSNFTLQLL